MTPFSYPTTPHMRRHGPQGYADYASFRPWLRDEFTFKWAFCLLREQWGRARGTFHLDHFHATVQHPDQRLTYENLLYCCATCNEVKGNRTLPDPCRVLLDGDVEVVEDGVLQAAHAGGAAAGAEDLSQPAGSAGVSSNLDRYHQAGETIRSGAAPAADGVSG